MFFFRADAENSCYILSCEESDPIFCSAPCLGLVRRRDQNITLIELLRVHRCKVRPS